MRTSAERVEKTLESSCPAVLYLPTLFVEAFIVITICERHVDCSRRLKVYSPSLYPCLCLSSYFFLPINAPLCCLGNWVNGMKCYSFFTNDSSKISRSATHT